MAVPGVVLCDFSMLAEIRDWYSVDDEKLGPQIPSLPPNNAELVWLRVKGGGAGPWTGADDEVEDADPGRDTVDNPKEEAELGNLESLSDAEETDVGDDGIEMEMGCCCLTCTGLDGIVAVPLKGANAGGAVVTVAPLAGKLAGSPLALIPLVPLAKPLVIAEEPPTELAGALFSNGKCFDCPPWVSPPHRSGNKVEWMSGRGELDE